MANGVPIKKVIYGAAVAAVLAAAVGTVAYWLHPHGTLTWQKVNAMIAHDFPNVPQMNVHTLDAWLHNPKQAAPMLLDVRSRAEYAVSHLHGAKRIDAAESVKQAMAGVPHTQPIVTYCSVGYRSSAYARRLIKNGFTAVHDLQGSIFQWANDGLPVYRNGRVVHHVHPYNHYWGQLLKRSLWAFHVRHANAP